MVVERSWKHGLMARIPPWPLPSHFEPFRILHPEGPWAPAIEMYDRKNEIVVRVEIPGVKKEDIEVSIMGDALTIKGERKTEVKPEDYYGCERCYGSFARTITIPSPVEPKSIEATHDNGILEIILPKVAGTKPKKVEISTSR